MKIRLHIHHWSKWSDVSYSPYPQETQKRICSRCKMVERRTL